MDDFFHIFDFDFTLYRTVENIYVWSPRGDFFVNGRSCIRFLSNEFLHYNIGTDEELDQSSYMDFNFVNFNKAIPIKPMVSIFNSVKNKMILTARPQTVDRCIKKQLKGDYDIIGLGNGDPFKKIDFLESLDNSDIIIYDDSQKVIDLCNLNSISNVCVKSFSNKCSLNYTFY